MTQKNLTELFGHFAGQEIPMERWEMEVEGEVYVGLRPVREPDPVVGALNKTAQENNLELMIWNPEMALDAFKDFLKDNTANVYLKQDNTGSYRISDTFTLGYDVQL